MLFSKSFVIAGLAMVAYSRPAPASATPPPFPGTLVARDDEIKMETTTYNYGWKDEINHAAAFVKAGASIASSVFGAAHSSHEWKRDLSAVPTSTSLSASPTTLDTQPTSTSESTSAGSTQPLPSGSRPSTTVQASQPTARSVPEYYYR